MKNIQKFSKIRRVFVILLILSLSACSTLTARKEDRLQGHAFSGITNNLSAWNCGTLDLLQETKGLGAGRPFVWLFSFPALFLSNTFDLIFSAGSDLFTLPYSLITSPEKERSEISDCSSGVWTAHY